MPARLLEKRSSLLAFALRYTGSGKEVVHLEELGIETDGGLEFPRRFVVALVERHGQRAGHMGLGGIRIELERLATRLLGLLELSFGGVPVHVHE